MKVERTKLVNQILAQSKESPDDKEVSGFNYKGEIKSIISTGSTLLDLAISGGRVHGGGIPSGILVEVFGASGTGKTVLLCEIAGAVKRKGGQVMFFDPEGRLNKTFAQLFDFSIDSTEYFMPDTVKEVFAPVRAWSPEGKNKDVVHGIFADSLAALSTSWELEGKDEYGMRRAKEFSEELRKTCRILAQKNYLMVCSNQVRQNLAAGPYGQKYKTPGGEAVGFYSSLRLQCSLIQKIKRKRKIAGKEFEQVVGIETQVMVYKSSVWKPYHTAPLFILFDYGIDDIQANLRFLKEVKGETEFILGKQKLGRSIDDAIAVIEKEGLEKMLREEVILLWERIENEFSSSRKTKVRTE